ncbi:MAG: hypothetical protein ACRYGR_04545 [Janthinobacterium lividum]
MAGRIISTSPLATQSHIHKFYRSKTSNHYVNFQAKSQDYFTLFCAKNDWLFALFSRTGDIRFITS